MSRRTATAPSLRRPPEWPRCRLVRAARPPEIACYRRKRECRAVAPRTGAREPPPAGDIRGCPVAQLPISHPRTRRLAPERSKREQPQELSQRKARSQTPACRSSSSITTLSATLTVGLYISNKPETEVDESEEEKDGGEEPYRKRHGPAGRDRRDFHGLGTAKKQRSESDARTELDDGRHCSTLIRRFDWGCFSGSGRLSARRSRNQNRNDPFPRHPERGNGVKAAVEGMTTASFRHPERGNDERAHVARDDTPSSS